MIATSGDRSDIEREIGSYEGHVPHRAGRYGVDVQLTMTSIGRSSPKAHRDRDSAQLIQEWLDPVISFVFSATQRHIVMPVLLFRSVPDASAGGRGSLMADLSQIRIQCRPT